MDILKNDILQSFKKHLERRYKENNAYFDFGIDGIEYKLNQKIPELKIFISHYTSELEKEITLIFRQFEFYFMTEESYLPHLKNDFKGFSFFEISKENELMKIMLKNGYDLQFFVRDISVKDFFVVRVIGQNYFVDVLTNKLPEILYSTD